MPDKKQAKKVSTRVSKKRAREDPVDEEDEVLEQTRAPKRRITQQAAYVEIAMVKASKVSQLRSRSSNVSHSYPIPIERSVDFDTIQDRACSESLYHPG